MVLCSVLSWLPLRLEVRKREENPERRAFFTLPRIQTLWYDGEFSGNLDDFAR
jgi:hypothetical protein